MCGICGFSSVGDKIDKDVYKRVLQLLMLNQTRGSDSTGLATLNYQKRVRIFKDIEPAMSYASKLLNKYDYNNSIILGHTRLATTGAVTQKNAHPFQYNKIVGVHNGYVHNYEELGKFQVDSQAIFSELNKQGNDYEKAFSKLSGMFAIAWFNKEEPTVLYLVRDSNPLYIALTDEGCYFSSQEESLRFVLFDIRKTIINLESETVYKIVNGKISIKHDIEFKETFSYNTPTIGFDKNDYYPNYGYSSSQKKLNDFELNEDLEEPTILYKENMEAEDFKVIDHPSHWEKCNYCGANNMMLLTDGIETVCETCLGEFFTDLTEQEFEAKKAVGKVLKNKK